MSSGTTSRLVASCLGLSGFAVAVVAGLAVGNPGGRILTVALACMIGCHIVGLAVGMVGEKVIADFMRQYKATHPADGAAASPAPSGTPGGAT